MAAFNVVRFKVKLGQEENFLNVHRDFNTKMKGARKASLIKTGDRTYCFIGEWDRMGDIVEARSIMVGNLDKVRHMLEDLGSGLGVTDPVSGEAVVEMKI